MGLDVYLYRYEDRELTERLEAEASAFAESAWHYGGAKYDDLTEEQRKTARAACAEFYASKGLDDSGCDATRTTRIALDYPAEPDHLFKIGYFRSSYNESGIDRLMRAAINETLGSLFEVGDDSEFQPNWAAALARTEDALKRWKAVVAEHGAYKITRLDAEPLIKTDSYTPPSCAGEAMRAFLDVKRKNPHRPGFDWFSTLVGNFFLGEKSPVFRGFISGYAELLGRRIPCVYAVYEDDGVEWCWTALEIVAETCRYVLSQPDPERYYLHWSG